jgi:hypothetical protein
MPAPPALNTVLFPFYQRRQTDISTPTLADIDIYDIITPLT